MSTVVASARTAPVARRWPAVGIALGYRVAPALVVLVAAALRLAGLGRVPVNPFYDAAVRSMGMSWRAFSTGAIDPGATVSVDKPPVDLWLQVASTKAFGFTPLALHLPEALGGVVSVLALYEALRVLFGRWPALAGALVLAVLPMAVVTARSDTMDSVMAALVLIALAFTAHAVRDERPALLLCAGAALGLAFEVKLFEALVPVPALAALWWFGTAGRRRTRLAALAGAGAVLTAVALAWLVALSFVPGPKPWAFGSTNGSAWNATFVYDGLDRLRARPAALTPGTARHDGTMSLRVQQPESALAARRRSVARSNAPAPPGPGRLFAAPAHLGGRFGIALGIALAAWVLAGVAGVPRGLGMRARAGWWALSGWLATGVILFSAQATLKPRYLEAFDPVVAAVLGVGLVLAGRRLAARDATASRAARLARPGAAALLGLAVAVLGGVSIAAAAGNVEDAGAPGALPGPRLDRLSGYLLAHRSGARYEAASVSVGKAASLIARDGRPVLVLTATDARPIVPVRALATAAATGQVRFALLGSACTGAAGGSVQGCSPAARWIRAHGIDVSRAAGQPHRGLVYALSSRTPRGMPRSAASTKSPSPRSGQPRRASRAPHR